MSQLLTVRQVAERLGLKSPETVLVWIRAGKLKAIKLPSGAIRVSEAQLEAHLEAWATPGRGVVKHHGRTPPAATLVDVKHHEDEE